MRQSGRSSGVSWKAGALLPACEQSLWTSHPPAGGVQAFACLPFIYTLAIPGKLVRSFLLPFDQQEISAIIKATQQRQAYALHQTN